MYETEPFLYDYDFETASTQITIKSLKSIVKKDSLHNGSQRKGREKKKKEKKRTLGTSVWKSVKR